MLIKKDIRNNLLTFLLCISMICLVFSKYVLSMSLIGILCLFLFMKEEAGGFSLGLNPKIYKRPTKENLWPFTGFLLFFGWIVLSVLWSGNAYSEWFHDVQSKLTFVGVAVIFGLMPKMEVYRLVRIHQVFGFSVLVGLLLVLYVYIPSYADITLRIGRGRPIPTPIDHVRFSLMVAYACLSFGIMALEAKKYGLAPKEKYWMSGLSLLFFVSVHVLAVRTGIFLLYVGLAGLLLYMIVKYKKFVHGGIALLAAAIIPVIAYYNIESFRNKVYYTKYDIQQMLASKGDNFSDGDRIRSIKDGIFLWKQKPFFGHGAGEYKKAMHDYYVSKKAEGKELLPHNQYIRTGMAYGWIGLIFLLSGFGFILLRRKSWSNFLLLLISILLAISLIVEANLDRYYALVFFMLFIGINSQLNGKDESKK